MRLLSRALRILVGASALAFGMAADWRIPDRYIPWTPLDMAAPLDAFTRGKIVRAEGHACRMILARGGVAVSEVPERDLGGFCSQRDAVRLTGGVTPLRPHGLVMTCRQALAVSLWERKVLQPAAVRAFGERVTAVETFGSYSCRRMYGASEGRISQHASANALDVAGVVLADGRRVTVLGDWRDQGERGGFLREILGGACRIFSVTLGPDYNAAHRDHLHLDMTGGWGGRGYCP